MCLGEISVNICKFRCFWNVWVQLCLSVWCGWLWTCVSLDVFMYLWVFVNLHVFRCISVDVCEHACVYMSVNLWMSVNMCVCRVPLKRMLQECRAPSPILCSEHWHVSLEELHGDPSLPPCSVLALYIHFRSPDPECPAHSQPRLATGNVWIDSLLESGTAAPMWMAEMNCPLLQFITASYFPSVK